MYRKGAKSWLKHLDFILLDILCLQISFLLAYMIRHGIRNPYAVFLYQNMAIIMTLIDVVIMIFMETLKNVVKRGYYQEFIMTVRHVCMLELVSTFYLVATQSGGMYSRAVLFLMAFIYIPLSYVIRVLWKLFLRKKIKGRNQRSLLIITTEDKAEEVVRNIRNHKYDMFRYAGIAVMDKDLEGTKMAGGIEVVANRDTVVEYICREWIDEVFVHLPDSMEEDDLLLQLSEMGIVVHVKLCDAFYGEGRQQLVERLGKYTVLTTTINAVSTSQLFWKRLMDIFGGLVGCLVTGILCIILTPLIKLQSPGPVFFAQTRVGKNGKLFKMYKFRSMYMDAEARKQELLDENRVKDGMMFKLDFDPRIIGSKRLPDGTTKKGIGNIIRDYSLDEFPQFFNVLKGEMSLVGTRPPTLDEWNKYKLHHRARLATKPGITGIWQVSGRSNITNFEEVVKLDRTYIDEWSIGMDIKILLKTVVAVFRKEGSM